MYPSISRNRFFTNPFAEKTRVSPKTMENTGAKTKLFVQLQPLIGILQYPAGGIELPLFLRCQLEMNHVADTVASHDTGNARIHVLLPVFTAQQG